MSIVVASGSPAVSAQQAFGISDIRVGLRFQSGPLRFVILRCDKHGWRLALEGDLNHGTHMKSEELVKAVLQGEYVVVT